MGRCETISCYGNLCYFMTLHLYLLFLPLLLCALLAPCGLWPEHGLVIHLSRDARRPKAMPYPDHLCTYLPD